MKTLMTALCLSAFAMTAAHAGPSCADQAADKKLNGAAKTSFVKKCTKDMAAAAQPACDAKAAEKKLNGAAKTSFVKKCVKDGGPSA